MKGEQRAAPARYYQPWPAPVLAAQHTDPSTLPAIGHWVTALRQQGRVSPEVTFTIRAEDAPVGVLTDHAGEHLLPRTAFLVYGRDGLYVLDAHSFWRCYHDPAVPDRRGRAHTSG